MRQAVVDQNTQARAAGGPTIKADALLAMAEELLPRLKAAEWRDRAEAAVGSVDDIALRDLRAVVTGSESVARDDVSRALASTLRETLQRRSEEQRTTWLAEIAQSLDEGRVVRALRTSGRPPEPGTTFPAELATRLTDAAGAAMAADVDPERWAAVLEAVVSSPVRKTVQPQSLPAERNEALLAAARQAAPRVPALGALLGIDRPTVGAAGRPVPAHPRARRARRYPGHRSPAVAPGAELELVGGVRGSRVAARRRTTRGNARGTSRARVLFPAGTARDALARVEVAGRHEEPAHLVGVAERALQMARRRGMALRTRDFDGNGPRRARGGFA